MMAPRFSVCATALPGQSATKVRATVKAKQKRRLVTLSDGCKHCIRSKSGTDGTFPVTQCILAFTANIHTLSYIHESQYNVPRGTLCASRLLDFFLFLPDLDAEGFEEFYVLIVDFEFGVGAEGGDEGSLVSPGHALFADADGGFEDEEDVVAAFLDAGDDFGDLFGLGQRFIDGFAQVFHELLELRIHESPSKYDNRGRPRSQAAVISPSALYAGALLKSTCG